MTWLHWTLMFVGGLVAYGVVAYPFCCWLGRKFRASRPAILRGREATAE